MIDAQVHQTLGLNTYPPASNGGFDPNLNPNVNLPQAGNPGPGNNLGDLQRMAYAAAQRGEALVGAARAEAGFNPALGARMPEIEQLARGVDGYYDALSNPAIANQPDFARSNYVAIVRQANAVGVNLDAGGDVPTLRGSWTAFASAHNLLRNSLNLNFPTPDVSRPPRGSPRNLATTFPPTRRRKSRAGPSNSSARSTTCSSTSPRRRVSSPKGA